MKTHKVTLIYPLIVLTSLVAVPIVLLTLQLVASQPLPNVNLQVVGTLQNYYDAGAMNQSKISHFFDHYYYANSNLYFEWRR